MKMVNALEKLQTVSFFDFYNYLDRYNAFFAGQNLSLMISYWNKKIDSIEPQILKDFNWLFENYEPLSSELKRHVSTVRDYNYELFDLTNLFSDIQMNLQNIKKLPQYMRVSNNNVDVTSMPVVGYFVQGGDTLESISFDFFGDTKFASDISAYNHIHYYDVGNSSWIGRFLKVPLFKNSLTQKIDNIVDGQINKNILGKDIDRNFSFNSSGDDIRTVEYEDCFLQFINILLKDSDKGTIPEFPSLGCSLSGIIGRNLGALSINSIKNEIISLAQTETTLKEMFFRSIKVVDDAVFLDIDFQNVLGKIINFTTEDQEYKDIVAKQSGGADMLGDAIFGAAHIGGDKTAPLLNNSVGADMFGDAMFGASHIGGEPSAPVDKTVFEGETFGSDMFGTETMGGEYIPPIEEHLISEVDNSLVDNAQFIRSIDITEMAQSFIGDGTEISHVEFWIKRHNVPEGNCRAVLYAHTGSFGFGSIPGDVLATSEDVSVDTILDNINYSWIRFNFVAGTLLELGVPYVISFQYTGVDGFSMSMSAVAGALGNYSQKLSGVWSAISYWDVVYKLFGYSVDPSPVTVPVLSEFSWLNQGVAVAVQEDVSILLTSSGTGAGQNILRKSFSGNLIIEAGLNITWGTFVNGHYPNAGLIIRESGTGKEYAFCYCERVDRTPGNYSVDRRNNYSSYLNTYAFSIKPIPTIIYFKIEILATNINFYYSIDQISWILFGTLVRTEFINPDEIGFFVESDYPSGNISYSLFYWKETIIV
jgi:hypothetical protein